jgi:Predicted integral membrane protein (DUF2269)
MYNTVLYVHFLAVVGAFLGMGVMLNSIIQLRSATVVNEALRCSALAGKAARFMPVATLLLLATGAYMTQDRWSWSTPWVFLSVIGLLVTTFVGAGVLGSRERALHVALERAAGSGIDANLAAQLRAPVLLTGSGFNAGLVCAVMFVMVGKPELLGGVSALVIGALAGASVFAIASRPRQKTAPAEA